MSSSDEIPVRFTLLLNSNEEAILKAPAAFWPLVSITIDTSIEAYRESGDEIVVYLVPQHPLLFQNCIVLIQTALAAWEQVTNDDCHEQFCRQTVLRFFQGQRVTRSSMKNELLIILNILNIMDMLNTPHPISVGIREELSKFIRLHCSGDDLFYGLYPECPTNLTVERRLDFFRMLSWPQVRSMIDEEEETQALPPLKKRRLASMMAKKEERLAFILSPETCRWSNTKGISFVDVNDVRDKQLANVHAIVLECRQHFRSQCGILAALLLCPQLKTATMCFSNTRTELDTVEISSFTANVLGRILRHPDRRQLTANETYDYGDLWMLLTRDAKNTSSYFPETSIEMVFEPGNLSWKEWAIVYLSLYNLEAPSRWNQELEKLSFSGLKGCGMGDLFHWAMFLSRMWPSGIDYRSLETTESITTNGAQSEEEKWTAWDPLFQYMVPESPMLPCWFLGNHAPCKEDPLIIPVQFDFWEDIPFKKARLNDGCVVFLFQKK